AGGGAGAPRRADADRERPPHSASGAARRPLPSRRDLFRSLRARARAAMGSRSQGYRSDLSRRHAGDPHPRGHEPGDQGRGGPSGGRARGAETTPTGGRPARGGARGGGRRGESPAKPATVPAETPPPAAATADELASAPVVPNGPREAPVLPIRQTVLFP